MKKYNLDQDKFKYLYRYEPKQGKFFRIRRNNRKDVPATLTHDTFTGYRNGEFGCQTFW